MARHPRHHPFAEPPRQTAHSFQHEESPALGMAMRGAGENEPYFSASSSNMNNMNIVPGAITFQNIDEMTKVCVSQPKSAICLGIYFIYIYIFFKLSHTEIGAQSTRHTGIHHRGGGAAGARQQGLAVYSGK